jgi:hypothetical protein
VEDLRRVIIIDERGSFESLNMAWLYSYDILKQNTIEIGKRSMVF